MKVTRDILSEVAPTLADLKKLPMELKCRLLLARLTEIGQHPSALNKHNLMMHGDPYALAHGYPDIEKMPVKEYLLGAPWTRLVNEGYLVDFTGQGFYKVTEEGKQYLDQDEPLAQPSPISATVSKSPTTGAPRALLSYSWDSPEHQRWVTNLAERLQGESGVEIIFDRWHLHPGDDRLYFMERAVADSDFVIIVCTPTYADRANKRQGGVGYESTVITAEMADRILTNKFIPVLRNGTWDSSLPAYLKSRIGVDFSEDPYREEEYEKLLRVLHREPVSPPPLAGKPDLSRNPASNQRPADFIAVEPKDGSARFRALDQPLGLFWNSLPFAESPDYEVFLAKGPATWLRMMPHECTSREWSHDQLMKCGRSPDVSMQPLSWINLQYLRAEDGIGAYSTKSNLRQETETDSVAFAFNGGELWSIDTGVLQISGKKHLYFLDIARTFLQRFRGYGGFLRCLGIEPPYKWIAGLEGGKGWRLNVPPPPNHISTSSGETCLNDLVLASGSYNPQEPAAMALRPFFNQLFRKCSMTIPEHIEELIRTNQKF
jgi:TIR domain